jgi:transposase
VAGRVKRAQLILLSYQGYRVQEIAEKLSIHKRTARLWIARFNRLGMPGLVVGPREGRPRVYVRDVGVVLQTALAPPAEMDLPFGSWTLDRLVAYLTEVKGIPITIQHCLDFLDQVEASVTASVERVSVILVKLATRNPPMTCYSFTWRIRGFEFVFQPMYAAYLNLIEPWWKVLKSLANLRVTGSDLGGIRTGCGQSERLLERAYKPFCLGKRRRHRMPRKLSIACMPKATNI